MEEQPRVLIVDDEVFNIKVLNEYLSDDYKIIVAKTGKQALEIIQGPTPPDLVLLDIIMPEMDGYEVCRQIKNDKKSSTIPVIFVTAISEAMDQAKAFEVGGVDYIAKPFTPVTVKARVKTHIQLSRTLRDLNAALQEVKKLSGLLPICASCKKIRDDKGYWNQIESYIEKHSDALFSHGICEECADELYGDTKWFQKRMGKKE